jgi:hypothetical protein
MKSPCPVAPWYPGIVWNSLGYSGILEGGTTVDYFRERIWLGSVADHNMGGYDLCLLGYPRTDGIVPGRVVYVVHVVHVVHVVY